MSRILKFNEFEALLEAKAHLNNNEHQGWVKRIGININDYLEAHPNLNLELQIQTNIDDDDEKSKRSDLIIRNKANNNTPVLIEIAATASVADVAKKLRILFLSGAGEVEETFIYDYQIGEWTRNRDSGVSNSEFLNVDMDDFTIE